MICQLTKECDGFPSIEKTMVVREGNNHYRSDHNLPVHNNRLLFDSVHTEHGGLWEVDDGSAIQGAKDAAVGAERMLLVRFRVYWRSGLTW